MLFLKDVTYCFRKGNRIYLSFSVPIGTAKETVSEVKKKIRRMNELEHKHEGGRKW